MDITTFPSQLFWLIITFGILYLFMWRTAIPKLRNTIEERQDKILLDINEAEKLKSEAEETLREYEEKIQIHRLVCCKKHHKDKGENAEKCTRFMRNNTLMGSGLEINTEGLD